MTLAIHHALCTSERATQFTGRFQAAPRLVVEMLPRRWTNMPKVLIIYSRGMVSIPRDKLGGIQWS